MKALNKLLLILLLCVVIIPKTPGQPRIRTINDIMGTPRLVTVTWLEPNTTYRLYHDGAFVAQMDSGELGGVTFNCNSGSYMLTCEEPCRVEWR